MVNPQNLFIDRNKLFIRLFLIYMWVYELPLTLQKVCTDQMFTFFVCFFMRINGIDLRVLTKVTLEVLKSSWQW
jgi:hypothetical protein